MYDPAIRIWSEIPNMPLVRPIAAKCDIPLASQAHTFVIVLNKQSYFVNYEAMEVSKYDKES